MHTTLEFHNRCRIEQTLVSRRKIWRSRCGRFRVVWSRCLFGPRTGREAIRDTFRAEARDEWGWSVISRHRTRERAIYACRKSASELK